MYIDGNQNEEEKATMHVRKASSLFIAGEIARDRRDQSDKLNRIVWDNVEGMIEINDRRVSRPVKAPAEGTVEKGFGSMKHAGTMVRLSNCFMVKPLGWRKFWWDIISGIAIMYSAVEVPFLIGFLSAGDYPALTATDLVVTAIFALDILVSFNLPIQDAHTNKYIYDRWKITKSYLKFWFWVDILATIPFDSIAALTTAEVKDTSGVRLIRLLRLFRLFKLLKFSQKTQAQIKELMENLTD